MEIHLLLRGLVLGLAIAAPVGPIGVLCIRQTLAFGWLRGFTCGLGAATADAMYGCIAGFGLTFIAELMIEQQIWLRLMGGVFLCYLGVKNFMVPIQLDTIQIKDIKLFGVYISTLLLTLSNPATILAFAAIFSGIGLTSIQRNYFSAIILVTGVFLGSGLWGLFLSSTMMLLKAKLTLTNFKFINQISGLVITAFGLIALLGIINIH
ncbi:MAG: LysE family translocator [Xenococcaceae cyanobacterium]